MPAVALLGPEGQIERSTRAFRRRYTGGRLTADQLAVLAPVTGGGLERARMLLGDIPAELEAVAGADGRLRALATFEPEPAGLLENLIAEIEDGPAMVYLKDPDGRYLHVNAAYTRRLGADLDRVRGCTDAELEAQETIDGPRVHDQAPSVNEPLELEYIVGPFADRPALAVLRFGIRDGDRELVAVCGVAAPVGEAHVAREECTQLMQIERWSRSDPGSVRYELLVQWGIAEAAASENLLDEPDNGPALAEIAAERDAAVNESGELRRELDAQNARADALHEASALAARRVHELTGELAAAASQVQDLERALAESEELIGRLQSAQADADATAELERAREEIAATAVELERAREDTAGAQADLQIAGSEAAAAKAGADQARAEAAVARADADQSRAAIAAANAESEAADRRARELEAAIPTLRHELDAARTDATTASAMLDAERRRTETLAAELEALREELEHRAAQAAAPSPAQTPASHPRWTPGSQLALTAALARATEWRIGARDAVKVLGSQAGWDVVTIWCPDQRGLIRCTAMWIGDAQLDGFETLTWQRALSGSGTAFGRALNAPIPAWLDRLDADEDSRLRDAATQGMQTAVLVPIRNDTTTVGLLELLSRERRPTDPDHLVSLEAVALQICHFAALVRENARPHWGLGRL